MSHGEAHAPTSTSATATADRLHGLMAEFDNPTALVAAANRARLAGYRQMDAYTPIPIEELSEALGLRRTRLPVPALGSGRATWRLTNVGGNVHTIQQVSSGRFLDAHEIASLDFDVVTRPQQ